MPPCVSPSNRRCFLQCAAAERTTSYATTPARQLRGCLHDHPIVRRSPISAAACLPTSMRPAISRLHPFSTAKEAAPGAVTRSWRAAAGAAAGKPGSGRVKSVEGSWWEAAEVVWNDVDWDTLPVSWEKRYWDLVLFLYRYKRHPLRTPTAEEEVPEEGDMKDVPMWRWSRGQADYKVRLDPTQHRLLQALPSFPHPLGVPPLAPGDFQLVASALADFVAEHGRLPTEKKGVTTAERKLANLVADLKGRKNNHGLLSKEEEGVLEAIPGWEWDAHRKLGRPGGGSVVVPESYARFAEELGALGQRVPVVELYRH